MLQDQEIEQRFQRVEQAIGEATRNCQSGQNVSPQLKHVVEELDRQVHQAQSQMQSHDQGRIRQCVDDMESLGDEARKACSADIGAPRELKEAITRVHNELSDFKHKLH